MKKTALLLILIFALSGCSSKVDIEELISAYELPEYTNSLDIEISDADESDISAENPGETDSEVISID